MSTDTLANIPLFGDMAPEQRAELSNLLKQEQVTATQPIFWIGDTGTSFYIIKHGRVMLSAPDESGQEMTLAELSAGQFFGELSLLDGGRRTATARAMADSTLLSLDRGEFQKFLLKHPAATLLIISELGRRQREMVEKLRGVANVNEVFKDQTTAWNRVADTIASVSASKGFVLIHLIGVVFWILLNLVVRNGAPDPYPFPLLAVFASLEAIFLSIFVLISQNRQTEKDRISADLDYQVNLKAHVEVMQLHHKMDELKAMVEKQRQHESN